MAGLTIKDVSKKYGEFTVLEDVNLQFNEGELVCFLGPSGCGKTTLFRMIAGLEDVTSGTISLDGTELTNVPVHQRNVGMVFQSFALFPHLSAIIVPQVLGRPEHWTLSVLITDQAIFNFNMPFASALAVVLLAISGTIVASVMRFGAGRKP